MSVENSACAAKRRSRETAVCAAMTAAHQKSSVLYCAFMYAGQYGKSAEWAAAL